MEGEVVEKRQKNEWGVPSVRITIRMTHPHGKIIVTSVIEVEPSY